MILLDELNMCEIYLVTNTTNGKKYVGKADKYVSKNNNKWGTSGRWKLHVREAFNIDIKDHCALLNAAIRKYKPDSFEVGKICDCSKEDVHEMERKYIKEHNSLVPNGYNLNQGGIDGMDSAITKAKKTESRKVVPTEKAKRNNSLGQIGNRREKKDRKNPDDNCLPKYVHAIRKGDQIKGYFIKCYPIGIQTKMYINKSFMDVKNPQAALEKTLQYLQELKETYEEKVQQEIKARRDQEYAKKTQAKAELLNPPKQEYIYPIIYETKIAGYKVSGLKDTNGHIIPEKEFNDCQQNRWNLQRAEKYVQQIKMFVEKGMKLDDWSKIDTVYKCDKQGIEDEHLPKYINITKYNGEKCGYVVNGYPLPDGKKSCKKFTKSKFIMEERYKQALAYLEELKQKHPLTT